MQGGERYNSISNYLKKEFGSKTVKLSIEGGFTCPNRDGTLSYGGCSFCSSGGSGEFASDIASQIKILSSKWPGAVHLAYFQSHTNTYAPVCELRRKYFEVLQDPEISGIVIATRPDCLGYDVLNLLEEINSKYFMWVELGLQTIHDNTARRLNMCHYIKDYDRAVTELNARNIKYVSHLILGLPGESRADMLESVKYACSRNIFGIKLHMLNVIKTSELYRSMPEYVPFESIDEYTDLVVDLLTQIPREVTIHRLTADAPRNILVSPEWSYRKRTILNEINRKLKERNLYQGCLCDTHCI